MWSPGFRIGGAAVSALAIVYFGPRRWPQPDPRRFFLRRCFGAGIADILPTVPRSVTAGGVSRRTFRPWRNGAWPFFLLVEGLLGDAEGIDGGGHPPIEHHLRNYLGELLLGYADVKRPGDVPLDHLWAVSEHDQCGDGAEASGTQVDRWAVVDLPVYDRVDQPHYLRRKFGHRRWRLRVVLGAVVAHAELGSGLVEIRHQVFLIFVVAVLVLQFQIGLVWAQVRVVFVVVFGGHN